MAEYVMNIFCKKQGCCVYTHNYLHANSLGL